MTKKNKATDTVESRLEKLSRLNGGRLTPQAVVDDARDPASPLHERFEWDDSTAAHQYRLSQARELIRTVRCQVDIVSNTIATPHYVRDPSAGHEQGYIAVSTARNEHDIAVAIMRDETGRVLAALERARGIADVLGMDDEIATLIDSIRSFRTRAKVA